MLRPLSFASLTLVAIAITLGCGDDDSLRPGAVGGSGSVAVDCQGCLLGSLCHANGESHPENSCEVCVGESGEWTARADGTSCDDGAFCTVGDTCEQGVCAAGTSSPCDDGIDCNGAESCDEMTDACQAGTNQCQNGSMCVTGSDSCELTCAGCAIDGVCYPEGSRNPENQCQLCDTDASADAWSMAVDGSACDDGNFCNGADSCVSGSCAAGARNPCSDGVSCNGTESCDEATDSCLAGTSVCEVGLTCNTALDSCELNCAGCLIDGICHASGAINPDNDCQSCAPSTTATGWTALADGVACNDGNFCDGLDTCEAGVCVADGGNPCDDGVSCNGSESCDEGTDSCQAGTQTCGDGLSCNAGTDSCDVTCDGCVIADVCYPEGILNPLNPCESCQTGTSTTAWTPLSDGDTCGYNAECSSASCECATGWLDQGGFCSLPAITARDDEWTGTVYVGIEAILPVVNLLLNDENNVGEDEELRIVSVGSPINGTVSLDDGNIRFTGAGVGAGGFVYVVQSGDDASTQFEVNVSFSVLAAPTVVANSDQVEVKQGDSTVFTAASLLTNDVGTGLSVVSVQDPVGGMVTLDSGNISFESTGIAGRPAEFTYTIEDDSSDRSTGSVFVNVTPLDPVAAFVFADQSAFDAKATVYAPPTTLTIFNSWGRFAGDTFWANGPMATGDAASWTLIADEDDDGNIDGDLDANTIDDDSTSFLSGGYTINGDVDGDGSFDARFMQTANTGSINGFISPQSYDNYTHEVTLWSLNTDNDMVGVVLAYENDGASRALYVARTKGGFPPYSGWGILDSGFNVLAEVGVGSTAGGWSNQATRIKVIRTGDTFRIWATDWMTDSSAFFSPPLLDPNSLIEVDLSSTTNNITYYPGGVATTVSADLTRYQGAKPYGYTNWSQGQSSYLDVDFDGGVVDDVLLLLTNKDPILPIYTGSEVWRYSSGAWALSPSETIQGVLGFVRTVTNPDDGASFTIRQSEVELEVLE
ncbi:MAG: hypothetical protein AAF605_07685 [Myxococcota bacterium]